MPSHVKICAVIAALAVQNAYAVDSYLCITDLSTGYKYNDQSHEWGIARFKAGDKYLVKRSTSASYKWEVSIFGSKDVMSWCKEDFTSGHFLFCEGLQEFQMNNENLRFVNVAIFASYVAANANGRPDGGDTTSVDIGKCSEL